MKTISVIKKDMEFNRSLSSLIEVLKNIAVSQYRALEKRMHRYEQIFSELNGFFELMDVNKISHPFLKPRSNSQIVVAVTSDAGMLGGLNMQIINIAAGELEKASGKLVVIGEKGKIAARELGLAFSGIGGIIEEERLHQAIQLRDYLMSKFLEGKFGYLRIIYPHPVSFTVQRVETMTFLPYQMQQSKKPKSQKATGELLFESSPDDIVEYLISLWIGQRLYEIFGLSRLAEFAARFVHLEESSQRLKEIDKKMQLEYFRSRHELIDRNMRELFSARLLYAGS